MSAGTSIAFHALDPAIVAALRAGGPDAYGAPAERAISDGSGNPCRLCLSDIPRGAGMLIVAHRPFPAPQPYAETGPIFLCAECAPRQPSAAPPPVVATRKEFLLKGYTEEYRIRYGTGRITPVPQIRAYCQELLARGDVAFVDIRSATNNCFICRVRRA
ncbi:DUF1203 domain-containing protein [Pikeienuella piscinae]|uniref:DUF1203 domain-containing protein n=1 Tax=Pikeienuella piscinae TaxID=2748098 RepID=A0A7L5BZW6_9RHOB|nr:DUF1203 domain-containing protein [Pikeienuella piscinae]QIE56378.1 DUF1203 domain-containing protein [Pikeienuella piscinae]